MTLTDRREFLKRAGCSVAGLATLSGPLQGIFARGALAVGSTGVAPDNGGYGPLVPIADETDGVVRLHLPEGFEYRSFTPTGTPHERRRAHAGPPRRHGGVRRGPEPLPARPQPRGQRAGRRVRQRGQGIRPDGAGRHHHAGGQPARDQGRVLGQLQRHADELRRRGDALGHLAHLRGDGQRPRRRQRLHGRRQQPAAAQARLRLRGPGLLGRGRAPDARADPRRRPLRARGRRHRPGDRDPLHDRGQLRLPVGLLPLHRAAEPGDARSASRTAGSSRCSRSRAPRTRCSTAARRPA